MSPRIAVPVSTQDRSACTAVDVLRRSGDKWSVLLMALLESRPYGFNELDRAVDGLSRRILMRTLRTLVRDGLVDRAPQPGPAARVEYTLSELGRSLLPLIVAVGRWAEEHHDDISAARARHDAAAGTTPDCVGGRCTVAPLDVAAAAGRATKLPV